MGTVMVIAKAMATVSSTAMVSATAMASATLMGTGNGNGDCNGNSNGNGDGTLLITALLTCLSIMALSPCSATKALSPCLAMMALSSWLLMTALSPHLLMMALLVSSSRAAKNDACLHLLTRLDCNIARQMAWVGKLRIGQQHNANQSQCCVNKIQLPWRHSRLGALIPTF
jgi:hypothetical protein